MLLIIPIKSVEMVSVSVSDTILKLLAVSLWISVSAGFLKYFIFFFSELIINLIIFWFFVESAPYMSNKN